MPFFPVDDQLWGHPKVAEAGDAALGLWTRAGSYCANYLTEGVITAGMLRMLQAKPAQVRALVKVGLWHGAGHDCDQCPQPDRGGYVFHEWNKHGNRTREQVEADRAAAAARQSVFRHPDLRETVRSRDRDRCRYCARTVRWHDRRGERGGTYDHVDPTGGTTVSNLVVACRGCNIRKGRRTPAEAGMTLLPAPGDDPGPGHGAAPNGAAVSKSVSKSDPDQTQVPRFKSERFPGQARPGQVQTPLLTLVGRLAVGNAGEAEAPPAELIALWQEIAGPGTDLEDEARHYLERNLDRPAKDERAAWLGWLRKGAERRARCYCAAYGANGHPTHNGRRRASCNRPDCTDGWLPDDPDSRPIPCPTCRPHLRPVPSHPEAS